MLLGQIGHAGPGRFDQLHSRPQDGALRLPAVGSIPPLGQIRAEIGPVYVPKQLQSPSPPTFAPVNLWAG